MAAYYFLKLWHEVLHDPKMCKLSDRLYRRAIECFLMAGEQAAGGLLPVLEHMAWTLRTEPEELQQELIQLKSVGILDNLGNDNHPDTWLVKNFEKRQAATPPAERMRFMRQRQQRKTYYGDEPVTKRNTDRDRDKRRTEENRPVTPPVTERNTPVTSSIKPDVILSNASGLSTFPADQREWIEVVHQLAADHGVEQTTQAMTTAFQQWTATDRKDGRGKYKRTNLNWINWAQEILLGGEAQTEVPIREMTGEQFSQWLQNRANQQQNSASQ